MVRLFRSKALILKFGNNRTCPAQATKSLIKYFYLIEKYEAISSLNFSISTSHSYKPIKAIGRPPPLPTKATQPTKSLQHRWTDVESEMKNLRVQRYRQSSCQVEKSKLNFYKTVFTLHDYTPTTDKLLLKRACKHSRYQNRDGCLCRNRQGSRRLVMPRGSLNVYLV